MKYGQLPVSVGTIEKGIDEMMFYQYLPIKDKGTLQFSLPPQLDNDFIIELISIVNNDFINIKGLKETKDHYIYLTVKHLFVNESRQLNRPGIHSDGFMTDDINYIWSDEQPTLFYEGSFGKVPMNDEKSIVHFENKKHLCAEIMFEKNSILRLNQFNIHETNTKSGYVGLRCFIKISYSKDRYDLTGNSKNPIITNDWEYRERSVNRNIPQKI